ncbi:IS3 family transposase [Bacillus thuringiensis serovar andalousiensis]|uniref:IS3 family transposase n=1 Tax=Bacillus thuringiensis serovar andalousiensis TaxID=257985 RepID=A0A858MPI7_BACTU|nr:IS3 family transposase [Bacillus thuringiensis serovar andalousiensis]
MNPENGTPIKTPKPLVPVDEYIHYYNNERIQRKLDNMSPIAYRKHVV